MKIQINEEWVSNKYKNEERKKKNIYIQKKQKLIDE